ncbi:23S rRNA accumulation protein YceD [Paraneptunicella aestuarii]|uniref:23S rRNA accumulation protein YceD n=1 Tax=Paraneptunicella aestuarii TaxID=2831148 RepID=UPI001E5702A0|nr:23S rRNA accumulation protein YceD [Paraneptunicella aestuarii]UAA40405.1 23S rRNA accumulation protein YceD [Paraneptunicella aestuarii]
MQKVKLPKQVEPFKSASKRSDYKGIMLAHDMLRLNEAVDQVLDDIAITVKFDTDAQGLTYFEGNLQTTVSLICQRCNESFVHNVDVDFCFCPVTDSDNVDEIPETYEPVEVDEFGEINLLELFEDELILSLPIVAMHQEDDCKMGNESLSYGSIEPEQEKPNPFAVLKELKRNQE